MPQYQYIENHHYVHYKSTTSNQFVYRFVEYLSTIICKYTANVIISRCICYSSDIFNFNTYKITLRYCL